MKPVLLLVLEISGAAGSILEIAEIQEAAVGEEAGGVGLLVDRRAAHFLQA